jgi:lipopolysaccharide/colanic/teichoic acid biosynthesis glycosyltransferase
VGRIGKSGEQMASADAKFELSASRGFAGVSFLLKRLFDICIASVLLVVLSPVVAFTALVVFATLGRPLMFRQERCGKGERTFVVSKFRTMSDARDSRGTLLPDSQRQTAITAFLRKIRVDELPQLFAVLRGNMSFVGPRPLPYEGVAAFGAAGKLRCSIAPGMTGWAQVNGNALLTIDQKIALDIFYIDHRSLWMDIRIVFMTLRTIIVGETVDAGNVEGAHAHMRQRVLYAGASGLV